MPPADLDAVVAEDLHGDRGQLDPASIARWLEFWVTTTSAKNRLEGFEELTDVLIGTGADHADEPAELERLRNALAQVTRAPAGLKTASSTTGRRAPHHLHPRPDGKADAEAKALRTVSTSSGSGRCAPTPKNAPRRRPARPPRCTLVGAVQR